MANSQNGWPVDTSGAKQDRDPIYPGIAVPNGVLSGDVATVLRWVARRWNDTVEPLVAGSCWGWFVKKIEGSSTISNHASGTAIDLNASRHPMGRPVSENMSVKQIAACHALEAASGGVVRWGGDFSRPDPMHWEIVGSESATAALARKIESEGDGDMLPIAKGTTSDDVRLCQYMLNDLRQFPAFAGEWAEITADGAYGDATQRAVDAYRAHYGVGPNPSITAWQYFCMTRDMATVRAGRDGTNGQPGRDGSPGLPGKDGKDATLNGQLRVTGGALTVEAV
jgi:hypothetical protein